MLLDCLRAWIMEDTIFSMERTPLHPLVAVEHTYSLYTHSYTLNLRLLRCVDCGQGKLKGASVCLLLVQGGPSQRGQSSSMQQKSQVNKSSYGSSPYWANWDVPLVWWWFFDHQTMEEQIILQHQAKLQTHNYPFPPSALYIPFSNLWLLYVKYIYVCIYTVYMYW